MDKKGKECQTDQKGPLKEVIKPARLKLINKYPYYGGPALRFNLIEDDSIEVFSMNRRLELRYNGKFMTDMDEALGIIFYCVTRIVAKHHRRKEIFKPEIEELWELACMAETSSRIRACGIKLPEFMVGIEELYRALGMSDVYRSKKIITKFLLAEEIYEDLSKVIHKSNLSGKFSKELMDVISNFIKDYKGSDAENAMMDYLARSIAREARKIEDRAKNPGTLPLWDLFKIALDEISFTDWRKLLRNAIVGDIVAVSGNERYTYTRPSRRQSIAKKIILPKITSYEADITIILDVSGSMLCNEGNKTVLEKAIIEINSIISSMCRSSGAVVIPCDVEVKNVVRSTGFKSGEIVEGFGGTDMGRGLKFAAGLISNNGIKMRNPAKLAIVITDGYTPWPRNRVPNIRRLICVLVGKEANKKSSVPKWFDQVIEVRR